MWRFSTCKCLEQTVCIVLSGAQRSHVDGVYMHMLRTTGGKQSITNEERRYPAEPCGCVVHVYVTNRKCVLFALVPSGAMWRCSTCMCEEQKVCIVRSGSQRSHVDVLYM
ncbi:hypothetical protein DPMN_021423 [Dreissena polymorpha]|uniref:Uncharacterized protein n=1 Tax=Dreissena polymorpha TaxID=45954 RepID=A0A9D4NP63_DREPO|nr:hypothetical protein DPMN_021423 [Dreissena polymorpha]